MRKHLDKIFLIALAVIVVVTILAVMLSSYFSYQSYYKEATRQPERPPQTVLDDIDVKLVDGKEFYANNLARVTKDDLVVIAHYTVKTWDENAPEGFTTEQYEEAVAADEYELSTPADFAINGGDITVSFKRKSKSISVTLLPVLPERLEIVEQPYTIVYQTGATFDPEGMSVKLVYNDDSEKLLTEEQYTVDTETPLTLQDTKRTVTYSYGTDETPESKSVDVKISVQNTVNNGEVVEMNNAVSTCYLGDGTNIEDAIVDILGTYENGNRRLLDQEEYVIENDSEVLYFGKQYVLKVRSAKDNSLKLEIPVHVRAHLEGEDSTIVGGEVLTEAEYTFENGVFTKGDDVTFAGKFSNAVNNGKEGSITYTFTSYTDCNTDITVHAGNSYCSSDSEGYWMKPLQINTIVDLTVNDEIVPIPDSVILKGCGPSSTYTPLFGVYYDFTIPDVALKAGANTIKFAFKLSTLGEQNCWNEKLSTMNLDYLNIDAIGTALPETLNVTKLEIIDDFTVAYGTDFDELDIKALATLADGSQVVLTGDEITVTKPSGKAYLGTYEIKVAYKGNAQISDSRTYTFDDLKLEAEDADYPYVYDTKLRVLLETADSYHATEGEKPELVPGESVTSIKGLDYAVTNGYASYVSFDFDAHAGLMELHASVDNAYYFENGTEATGQLGGKYYTRDYKLNEVLALIVNGVEVSVPDSVVIEGYEYGWTNSDHIWLMFREIDLPNIRTIEGANNITLRAKNTTALRNRWSEIPVPRIDYIRLKPITAADTATVSSIAPLGEVNTTIGTAWSDVELPGIYATLSDGTVRLLDKSEYTVDVPEGNVTNERTELTVTYTASSSLTTKITVNAEKPAVNNVTMAASDGNEAGTLGLASGAGKFNSDTAGKYWGNLSETTVLRATFTSPESEKNHLWLDISNGNYQSGHFDEEQLNKVIVVKINGTEVNIPDSLKLQAWNDAVWTHFQWVDLGQVDIPEGQVTIEISFKQEIRNSYNSYVTGNVRTVAVKRTNPGA